MRLGLIPEGNGRNIVLKRQVLSIMLPSQILHRHAQVMIEANRVRDVPAVQAKSLLRLIMPVRPYNLCKSRVRAGKFLVLSFSVFTKS